MLNAMLHHMKHIQRPDTYIPIVARDTINNDAGLSGAIQDYLRWTSAFDKLIWTSDIPSALLLQIWRLLVNIML